MKLLQQQMAALKTAIPHAKKRSHEISDKSIAWQIDHALQVIVGVSKVIKESKPEEFQKKNSFTKWFIMTTGYIPRGKARAPKNVTPEDDVSQETLEKHFEKAQEAIKSINQEAKNKFFKHPLFGDLKRDAALRFLKIHTNHHLKIIKDIKKS